MEINSNKLIEKIKEANIWIKIWAVQNEINSLAKDEQNKYQNYKYFEESQVLKLLKPLLKKYRLALAIRDDLTCPPVYEKEDKQYTIKYAKSLTIINIDKTDESVNYGWWTCGSNQDLAKCKGSAETYAMKYILSKFFLIRVLDDNDPELKQVGEKK